MPGEPHKSESHPRTPSNYPDLITHPRHCSPAPRPSSCICPPFHLLTSGFTLILSSLCTQTHIFCLTQLPVCLAACWELGLRGKKDHKRPVSPNKRECIQSQEGADLRGLPAGKATVGGGCSLKPSRRSQDLTSRQGLDKQGGKHRGTGRGGECSGDSQGFAKPE